MKPHASAAVFLFSVATLLAGCGYHLVGASSSLPPQLKKLYVTPFVNRTDKAELDQRLTEQVTQEWVRRGRFQLVSSSDQADAVLSGTVVAAIVSPVQFDQQGRATEYQLTVTTDVKLIDRTSEKPVTLWHEANFQLSTSYPVNTNIADYFDRSVEAMDRLARDYARNLVVTVLEGF